MSCWKRIWRRWSTARRNAGRRARSRSRPGLRNLEARRDELAAERRARQAAEEARRALERSLRRRRLLAAVAGVTALVLAVVSIFAVQAHLARRDADRRRQQAEGLIDFMLDDLRQKLEPVGRLEILDDVGDKALEYFAAVPEGDLSDQELLSRSQALHQIGSVRFDLGDFEAANAAFRQSLALSIDLAARDPEDPERLFALAQSHFWVGYLLWQQRDLEAALEQFVAYRNIAADLVTSDPAKDAWQLEVAYAHSNLASVLAASGDPEAALADLRSAAGPGSERGGAADRNRARQSRLPRTGVFRTPSP